MPRCNDQRVSQRLSACLSAESSDLSLRDASQNPSSLSRARPPRRPLTVDSSGVFTVCPTGLATSGPRAGVTAKGRGCASKQERERERKGKLQTDPEITWTAVRLSSQPIRTWQFFKQLMTSVDKWQTSTTAANRLLSCRQLQKLEDK